MAETTAATATKPEFGALGALEARVDGERRPIGGPKQRAVLAVLIAGAGQRVSTDVIVDALYGEDSPPRARRTVQTYVANLRGEVGDVILPEPDGYVLDVPRSHVDTTKFEDLVSAAIAIADEQPETASSRIRVALALWRGLPYADVDGGAFISAEITRLSELRLAAVEARIGADLALGRHDQLIPELQSLSVEHPYREKFRGDLMLALYRSGRQTEALRAYEDTRKTLADELGLDPSPELQELEQQILDHDSRIAFGGRPAVTSRALLVVDLDTDPINAMTTDSQIDVLTETDQAVMDAISGNGGEVFGRRLNATYAHFPDVGDSLGAATDLLGSAPRPSSNGELPLVRMAIDVGDVELGGDETLLGPVVTRVAGIVAVAHPGQALLSSAAQTEAATQEGWTLRGLGEHPIPHVDQPQGLYQLVVTNAPADFPPPLRDALPLAQPGGVRSMPGYELREQVGQGPQWTTWLAYQPSVGREVAIKVVASELANRPDFVRRFELDALTVARLEHPHIIPLYDYWRDLSGAYVVSRWIRGSTLADALSHDSITDQSTKRLVEQIGSALRAAHAAGVSHGNIQPDTIIAADSGDFFLTDFTIVRDGLGASSGPLQDDVDAFIGVVRTCLEAAEALTPDLVDVLASPGSQSMEDFLGAWIATVEPSAPAERPLTDARNPYRGLSAFTVADARDFHGREEVLGELLNAVGEGRFTALVGPSGVGKSSLVHAGLLPAVVDGAVAGSDNWLVATMTPGSHPFEALASALVRVATNPLPDLDAAIGDGDRGLLRTVQRLFPENTETLVVIDQFEELFSLSDAESRGRFLRSLTTAATDAESTIRIVITIRADFFDQPLEHPGFGELLRSATLPLSAPTDAELQAIIELPAQGVGVDFEPGLAERIRLDAGDEPGRLPLLEYALTELFSQRSSDLMTTADYEAMGGVLGALGGRAAFTLEELGSQSVDLTRQVFLRLVTVGDSGRATRRRERLGELRRIGDDPEHVDNIVGQFAANRLLTLDRDPVTRGPTAEVAHEALFIQWGRLAEWIDERRDDLLTRRRLTEATQDWETADRDAGSLLTGGRLTRFQLWADSTDLSLNANEVALLAESTKADEERKIRARFRRRRVLAGFAAAAVIASVFALLAFLNAQTSSENAEQAALNEDIANQNADLAASNSQLAEEEAATAQENASLAQARELVLEAEKATATDPELGTLLALEGVESFEAAGEIPGSAVTVLRQAVEASRVVARLPGGSFVAISPDGSVIATPSGDGGIAFWDAESYEVLDTIYFESGFPLGAWYGQDGTEIIAITVNIETGAAAFVAANLETGAQETLPGPEDVGETLVGDIAGRTSPTGDVAARYGTSMTVWDRDTHDLLFERQAASFSGLAYSTDGQLAYVELNEAGQPVVQVVDDRTGELLDTSGPVSFLPNFMAFSPDGRRIAMATFNGSVGVVDLDTQTEAWPTIQFERAREPAWKDDGSRLLVGGERPLAVIDAATGAVIREIPDGTGGSLGYGYIPGTDLVAVATFGPETLIVDASDASPEAVVDLESPVPVTLGMRITEDGDLAVLRDHMSGFASIDALSGENIAVMGGQDQSPLTTEGGWAILGSDGRFASTLDPDMRYRIYPSTGGSPVYTAPEGWVIAGINADASLAVIWTPAVPNIKLAPQQMRC